MADVYIRHLNKYNPLYKSRKNTHSITTFSEVWNTNTDEFTEKFFFCNLYKDATKQR